jgi:transcriptional regulator with XRE-family HTH domain
MTFGEQFKKWRLDAGLTQGDLAPIMNVSIQMISDIEHSRRNIRHSQLLRLSASGKLKNCDFFVLRAAALKESKERWMNK